MNDYELNLYDYWRIIRKRRLLIGFVSGTVMIFTLIFTNLQKPVYEAKAIVKLEPPVSSIGFSLSSQVDLWSLINTELRVMKSELIVREVVKTLGWGTVSSILAGLRVERIGDSNLIQIVADYDNAQKATAIVNTLAQVYIQRDIQESGRRRLEMKEYLHKQLEQAKTKLQEVEERKKNFVEKNSTTGMGNYLVSRLLDLQNQKSNLFKKYTPQHPEVIKFEQQIKFVEGQISKLPSGELELARLSRELRINEELYTLLSKKYKEAEINTAEHLGMASLISGANEPTYPIRPNKKFNLLIGALLGLFLGVMLAFVMENLDTSIGTIEDVEAFLKIPVLGVIPHIGPSHRSDFFNKLFNKSHYEKIIRLQDHLIIQHTAQSPYAEAYHSLRVNMKFATPLNKSKSLVFTSAGIEEGKTLTATNFSLAAAASGIRVVLVEGDLRRPAIGRILGLKSECGLTDIILGNISWREVLKNTPDFLLSGLEIEKVIKAMGLENLSVITSGFLPPNPGDILGSTRMDGLIKNLKEEFDLVVVDCPPVLLFADSLSIGSKVDGVVLVYKVGKMARGVLRRAKMQLENARAKILGVVVNDLKAAEMSSRYGYYYSNKYYSEQGEEPISPKNLAAFSPPQTNV